MSSERRNSLSPPERRGTIDPGAHDLAESDSEEHYSDAQSGPVGSSPASPIPRTRVERVDDKPAYGEVPGTQAYNMREGDAEPDEIAIIPDPTNPSPTEPPREARSPTPGGHPIPKTVVEETPDEEGAVTHVEVEEKHKADPLPDLTIKADGKVVSEEGGAANDTPISPSLSTPTSARARRKSSSAQKISPLSPMSPRFPAAVSDAGEGDNEGDEDDDFGDDFDDFEEGGDDGDFGDFDDGFQEAEETSAPPPAPAPAPAPPPAAPALSFPIPSFDDLDSEEIHSLTEPYLSALFPPTDSIPTLPSASVKDHPIFFTPRSASLWSQLVAPPPLQPPDWIRSRIRRLFLVSLGVPVDLDEILPASKQKKLVLPSLHRTNSNGSFRSSDSRSISRVRNSGANASRTSVDSQGNLKPSASAAAGDSKSKKDGKKTDSSSANPEKSFDLIQARQLCMTTDEALNGMTDTELGEHVSKLEKMQFTAKDVLDYWQKKTDEKIGDKEAFEGVIENLVKHARKVRK
ncbi:hypothetical protein QBC35DRAFT_481300 [Podospora australis]|uniref:Uncharacterized protein n=1 Tax=Podospora australis TaxID=1536484 RepID=A0AAN7APY1_9PEZI|nr:hypothetical protein QBC35DRAFT_481300 [Podospora australis]